MQIHPDLRALRGDDTPQRDAQYAFIAAIREWRERGDMANLLSEIEDFSGGCDIDDCLTLHSLFDEYSKAADALVGDFARAASKSLGDMPLGQVPLRHFTDGVTSRLLLAQSGNVTLTLVAVDGDGFANVPDPVTADFSPCEIWERVLAGNVVADLVDRLPLDGQRALLDCTEIELEPGDVLYRRSERQALQLRKVNGCLVSLRLQRRDVDAGPTREYRLADGVLVHQAAGNPQDSRVELMMALLGRLKRADAAPLLADIAGGQGSQALRWQALRECLALDTHIGFRALTAIARSANDELAVPAGALRSQLVEAHPQLAEIVSCLV